MTIAAELDKLRQRVKNSFTACQEKGAVLPTTQNTTTLPDCIKSISGGGSVKNQDKTIIENGVYTADTGFTGLGKVTVNVPSEGNVVEVIAQGDAKNYVGKEKVLLNKVTDFNGVVETANSEYSYSSLYSPSHLYGGIINGTILGNTSMSNGNSSEMRSFFKGVKNPDDIVDFTITGGGNAVVNLPPLNKYNVGAANTRYAHHVVKMNPDGSTHTIFKGTDQYADIYDAFYDDSIFVTKRDGTAYLSDFAQAIFINPDLSYSFIQSDNIYALGYYTVCKINGAYYMISTNDYCGVYKMTPDKGFEKIAGTQNIPDYQNCHALPLDEKGDAFLVSDSSKIMLCNLNKGSSSWTFVKNASESLKFAYGCKKMVAIPIHDVITEADIFVLNKQNDIEHYTWNGTTLTKQDNIFNQSDLGIYKIIGDFWVDYNNNVLVMVASDTTSKGCKNKLFVSGFGGVFNKEFTASSSSVRNWNDKTVVGFVKSNEGVDDFGNTILKVNTTLDPNAETWTDVGKSFGFKTTVEKGGLE